MKYIETREALKDKKLIIKSYPKAIQSKNSCILSISRTLRR